MKQKMLFCTQLGVWVLTIVPGIFKSHDLIQGSVLFVANHYCLTCSTNPALVFLQFMFNFLQGCNVIKLNSISFLILVLQYYDKVHVIFVLQMDNFKLETYGNCTMYLCAHKIEPIIFKPKLLRKHKNPLPQTKRVIQETMSYLSHINQQL